MGDDARDCGKWNRGNFSEMDFGTDLDLNDKGGLGGGGIPVQLRARGRDSRFGESPFPGKGSMRYFRTHRN